MKASLRKNCRIDYVNKYSLLVDFSGPSDIIVYYESGFNTLKDIYSTYAYKVRHEMDIDLFPFSWLPFPIKTK